ncbi:hypothetical protein HK096_010584, partial [Nowakowskiella sp. JEL0078]
MSASDDNWICKSHRLAKHTIFVSYRVASHLKLVENLVPFLEKVGLRRLGRNTAVFWDRTCLNFAQDFQSGFINGLQKSAVIVYLISEQSLEIMNAKVSAGEKDNVLVEIEEGLSLAQTQNVRLCPVLVGSVSSEGAFTPLQNVPSTSDSSKKVSIFSSESFVDKSHQYSGKSLRDTMERLFQNNVLYLNPNNLHEVAYNLVDLVDRLPEASE